MDTSLLSDVVVYSAQVTCVVAVGSILATVITIDAADVRYVYWRSLLALCLALPWLQVRQHVEPIIKSTAMVAVASSAAIATDARRAADSSAGMDWISLIGLVLVTGIVLRLVRVGVGMWRLQRLRTTGRLVVLSSAHDEVRRLVRARAEIRYVPDGQPVTFGVRHPVVLLPDVLQTQSDDIQRVVLCHELFHVRRRDWLWVVAEELVKAVLWFHPAVWWLISRVRLAREEVVDELTVLATGQRRAYMEALLVFADAPAHATAAGFARPRHLFRRMVLISKEAVMSSKRVLLSFAAMSAMVVAGVWLAVMTFPLTAAVSAQGRSGGPGATAGSEPGPIERRAKPITPENPIPRRTFSVTPQNPDGAAASAMVSLRITVDQQGRVVEVRSISQAFGGGRAGDSVATTPLDAYTGAAISAVRQWQYDPPADGPIAFDAVFFFAPGTEVRLLSHGGPSLAPGLRGGFAPPPPPPPPGATGVTLDPAWSQGAVRVGGNVALPVKLKHVGPVYPPIAQSARVQGVVILEVLISPDGHVRDARVLRSIPLLDQAAIDSVRQWEFSPTMLNGNPVPVIMTATVQFTLQ